MLLDGERVEEDVVLRTQPQTLAHAGDVGADVAVVDQSRAARSRDEAWNVHTGHGNKRRETEGRKEGRKEGNVLFNDALNTFYLRLYGIRHMVKDHSDSEKGNPLLPHRLLFTIDSKGSFICTFPQTG